MKNSYKLKTAILAGAVFVFSSCTEEKIIGIDPLGVPSASDYNIKVTVDQETNQYTLNIVNESGQPVTGVYPIWRIYSSNNPVRTTRDGYTGIITVAGDYDVELQVGNHNGVSEGVKTGVKHIDNTLINFTPYINNMTGGSSKLWHIDGSVPGHLGCGEPGTDGLNWWSATPYDKQDWGVYDNLMTFTNNGGDGTGLYTFDPGASGTIYVNTGITDLAPYSDYNTNDGVDYVAPAPLQENVPFTLYAEGVDLMLSFPKGTLIGYLPNVELYEQPKFKVNSITKNKIELTCDNGGIAWHYILAPYEVEEVFEGFKYDSEFNMWKNAEVSLGSTWFADGNWGELSPQPEVSVTNESIKLHTPAGMGSDQWQGQVHIKTNIVTTSDRTYDFSMWLDTPVDCDITVKPHPDGDDNTFFVADKQHFSAGGSCYYFTDLPGLDGEPLVLTLDFAGYPDTDFEVSKIVLKDHANDDGTVLPSDTPEIEEPEPDVEWVDVNSADNLWNGGTVTQITSWTANNDWGEITGPEITSEGNSYTLKYSEGPGGNQWQAQFALETDLSFSGDKVYDFSVTIIPTCDIAGVTVKPTNFADGSFWSEGRHDISAYEENVIKLVAVKADMPDFKLVFDFAGVEAGASIVVKDIIIQEHKEFSWVDVSSDSNLWNSGKVTNVTSWTANNDWGEIAGPDITSEGNSYTLKYSEGPGSNQWQAQFALETDLSFSGDKKYDFRVTINPTCDIAGVTVKPTNFADGSFWSDGRHDVEAYEDNIIELKGVSADMPDFKLVFDFAGVEAGASIVIKDIIIQEH